MFTSFLAGDSIIIGVNSDGAVGKAADSQYQNHGTVPGVIKIFARSSLFVDTKGKICMAIHFTGLLVWQYILRDFLAPAYYTCFHLENSSTMKELVSHHDPGSDHEYGPSCSDLYIVTEVLVE
ncbi:hypothetical protein Y032_0048g1706 [Ancylostoma ceylanicum]|uniref:Uncharacterized protein n=1 Tax=Ancylostoma ceylanicum TaxID=53326 RepID=A0A016UBQ7_9BILA|nr:hypothetical protein Y032_0048g1706 [Ancylostoma ceylanicum]